MGVFLIRAIVRGSYFVLVSENKQLCVTLERYSKSTPAWEIEYREIRAILTLILIELG